MDNLLKNAVIVEYGRSAVCKAGKGSFAMTHPLDFGSQVLRGVLARLPQLEPSQIDDLAVGCAVPENELSVNPARMLVFRSGLPETIPAQTINRFCSSGLQALATCAEAIMCGQAEVMVAGGIEYMSSKGGSSEPEFLDPWLLQNKEDAYMPMGLTAEKVAEKYGVTRRQMDQMAVESNAKAYAAQQRGDLNRSIIPVIAKQADGTEKTVEMDEGIRPGTNLEALANLKPAFKEGGRVTAASSSQRSDGAAFAVLMSEEKAKELNIRPVAKFRAFAVAGCDPSMMGLGPIYAVPKVMQKAGMTVDDMDVIELNEAFAAQAIPCMDILKLPKDKVNPWGGALALGHPMGATGLFLTGKALDYLQINGGKYALITMCIGGGQGAACILELL